MNKDIDKNKLLKGYKSFLISDEEEKIFLSYPFNLKNLLFVDIGYFRNNYNTTHLLFRSILLSFIVIILIPFLVSILSILSNLFFVCFLCICKAKISLSSEFKIENVISTYMLIFGGVFWELQKIFSQKWKYCADIFNGISFKQEFLKDNAKDIELEEWTEIKHKTLLCVDVLHMTLWNNDSFKIEFKKHLEFSIKIFSENPETDFSKLKGGKLREDEAGNYLYELLKISKIQIEKLKAEIRT